MKTCRENRGTNPLILYLDNLPPQKRGPVPIECKSGWAPEPVCKFWKRDKSLAPYTLVLCCLTYSMVQSPSWEANWFAASQEIPRILWNLKVHYRTHKRPPPVPVLGQPNPVHIPTLCCLTYIISLFNLVETPLKKDTWLSFETLLSLYQITRYHIPQLVNLDIMRQSWHQNRHSL